MKVFVWRSLAVLATAALLLLAPEAKANPLRYPKRAVNGVLVDLSPLFRWWTNHMGDRPLVAWVHVTGTIVGTNSLGWTVRGTADRRSDAPSDSESKVSDAFILKSPPLADRAKFEQLLAQRAELEAKLKGDKDQETELSSEKKHVHRNRALSNQLSQNIDQAKTSESDVQNQIKALDQELEPYGFKPTGGEDQFKYKVDCFALDLNQEKLGVRVYDHGGFSSYGRP